MCWRQEQKKFPTGIVFASKQTHEKDYLDE